MHSVYERRKFVDKVSFSFPGFEWYFIVTQLIFLALPRAVARFFVTRGIIARAEGTSLVGGSRGVLPQKNFQILRLRNAIFGTCHEICLRKIDLEDENGKQLQITIIKMTESKENKSIHRLDLSGSTGPGEAAALRLCYHVELTRLIFL